MAAITKAEEEVTAKAAKLSLQAEADAADATAAAASDDAAAAEDVSAKQECGFGRCKGIRLGWVSLRGWR